MFNCGIGMALVVAAADAAMAQAVLSAEGEQVFQLGVLEACDGPAEVQIDLPPGWPA